MKGFSTFLPLRGEAGGDNFGGMRKEMIFCGVMIVILAGCVGRKTEDEFPQKKVEIQTKEIPGPENELAEIVGKNPNPDLAAELQEFLKTDTFFRRINGHDFPLLLNGNFHRSFKFPGHEYPLDVKEVYPGIVFFDKYDTLKIFSSPRKDSIVHIRRVTDRVEFFEKGQLVRSVVLDEINPYLDEKTDVQIINHYSDAEGVSVFLGGKEKIDVHHLRQYVTENEGFTLANFWKNEIASASITNTSTTVMVFDSTGSPVFIQEFEGLISSPAIDPNGKYLMVSFSGEETVHNAGIKTQNDGFELWNIAEKKLLHRVVNPLEEYFVGTPTWSSENLSLGISFDNINSNTKNFRKDSNNVASEVYRFSPELPNLIYSQVIPIGLIVRQEEYLKKHNKYMSIEMIKSQINTQKNILNYGL